MTSSAKTAPRSPREQEVAGVMRTADLVRDYLPGHRGGAWTWEEEEADILVRECLCCGRPGHYQAQLERHVAEHGLEGMGVCLGDDGQLWDGHHRVVAARRLGIEFVPIETRAEADDRWLRDHGEVSWEDRTFGDAPPGCRRLVK